MDFSSYKFLSDSWWAFIGAEYTITSGLVLSLLYTILKYMAIRHPQVDSNSIWDLLCGWIKGFPGMAKWDGQEERRKDIARQEIAVDRKEIAIDKQEIKENQEKI